MPFTHIHQAKLEREARQQQSAPGFGGPLRDHTLGRDSPDAAAAAALMAGSEGSSPLGARADGATTPSIDGAPSVAEPFKLGGAGSKLAGAAKLKAAGQEMLSAMGAVDARPKDPALSAVDAFMQAGQAAKKKGAGKGK